MGDPFAVIEKVTTLMILAYIEQRAPQGRRTKFDQGLAKVAAAAREPLTEACSLSGAKIDLSAASSANGL